MGSILLTACDAWFKSESTESAITIPVIGAEDSAFQAVAKVDTFRERPFYVYIFDPIEEGLRLYNPHPQGGVYDFESLAQRAQQEGCYLKFAMNAGMYRPDQSAQGVLILEGKVVSRLDTATSGFGNFYLQPNGVFFLDSMGRAGLANTQTFDSLSHSGPISYATQSGPMLVIDSLINPLFSDPSPNLHFRNAVGVRRDGIVVCALSQVEVTFFELASFMRQQGCIQALYLDGFVSRMILPELGVGELDDGKHLVPLMAIFEPISPN